MMGCVKLTPLTLLCLAMMAMITMSSRVEALNLTFWNPSSWTVGYWDEQITAYQQARPDIYIQQLLVPWGDLESNLTKAKAAGRLPDIMWIGNTQAALFQKEGFLSDLNFGFSQWRRDSSTDYSLDFWKQIPYDYFLDGRWWTLPVISGTRMLFYNKAIFREVLGHEQPPANWSQFFDYALQINRTLPGVWGAGMPYQSDMVFWLMPLIQSYGGSAFSEDGWCDLQSPLALQAIDFYASFMRQKLSPALFSSNTLSEYFKNGTMGLLIEGSWKWSDFGARLGADNLGYAVLPRGPRGLFHFLGGEGFSIGKGSPNKQEAWNFMRWYMERDQGTVVGVPSLQSRTTALNCPAQLLPGIDNPDAGVISSLPYATPLSFPNQNSPRVPVLERSDIFPQLFAELAAGVATSQAVADTCARMNKQIEISLRVILPVWDGTAYEIAFTVILSICLFFVFVGAISNIIWRDFPLLWAASPAFCLIIWFGAALGYGALYFFVYPATQSTCLAKYWLGTFSYLLVFSALFAKTWRTWFIVERARKFQQTRITNGMVLGVVALLSTVLLLLLILWSAINTLDAQYVDVKNDSYRQKQCTSDNYWVWMGLILGYLAIISAGGLVIAFRSRKVAKGFNEQGAINFSIFACSVVACIVIPLVYALDDNPEAVLLAVVGGVAALTITLCAVFIPKFLPLIRGKEITKEEAVGMDNAGHRSSSPSVLSVRSTTSVNS